MWYISDVFPKRVFFSLNNWNNHLLVKNVLSYPMITEVRKINFEVHITKGYKSIYM